MPLLLLWLLQGVDGLSQLMRGAGKKKLNRGQGHRVRQQPFHKPCLREGLAVPSLLYSESMMCSP